jgi:hypothetical protein
MKITATAVKAMNDRREFDGKKGKQAVQKWQFEYTEQGKQYPGQIIASVFTPSLDQLQEGVAYMIDLSFQVKSYEGRDYMETTAYVIPYSQQAAPATTTRQPAAQAAMPAAYNDANDSLPF